MFSSHRSALALALALSASLGSAPALLNAQSESASEAQPSVNIAVLESPLDGAFQASSQTAAPADQTQAAPTPAAQSRGALTVQARIKARREQRRANALKEVYTHLYEVYVGSGYLRFQPGPELQRANEYSWDLGVTRYFNERLGVTVGGRGLYGRAYLGPRADNSGIYKPAVSEYMAMGGPTYRFRMEPKYSISGRIMGGVAYDWFSNNTHPHPPETLGLYADGAAAVVNASVPVEYNVSPNLGLRIAPDYTFTTFGSSTQNSLGFTGGVVVRWGKL
jgi:hypothetical protein